MSKERLLIHEYLNLWTLYSLLYGKFLRDTDKRIFERYTNDRIKRRIFGKYANEKKEKSLGNDEKIKKGSCKDFLHNHLGIDISYIRDNAAQIIMIRSSHNKEGRPKLIREFKEGWDKDSLKDLYETNGKILSQFKHPNFSSLMGEFLPEIINGELQSEKEINGIYVTKKNELACVTITPEMKRVLIALRKMNDQLIVKEREQLKLDEESEEHKEITTKINNMKAQILTWSLLVCFLHDGISSILEENQIPWVEEEKTSLPQNHFQGKKNENKGDMCLCSTMDLIQAGWTYDKIAENMLDNDHINYSLEQGDVNEGDVPHWEDWLQKRPEMFSFLQMDNTIAGNLSFCAYNETPEIIREMEGGLIFDGEVTVEGTSPLRRRGNYILFILNLSVNFGVPPIGNTILMDNFCKKILEYANAGIYFSSIYITLLHPYQHSVWDDYGFRFCCENIVRTDKPQHTVGEIWKLERIQDLDWSSDEMEKIIKIYDSRNQ